MSNINVHRLLKSINAKNQDYPEVKATISVIDNPYPSRSRHIQAVLVRHEQMPSHMVAITSQGFMIPCGIKSAGHLEPCECVPVATASYLRQIMSVIDQCLLGN